MLAFNKNLNFNQENMVIQYLKAHTHKIIIIIKTNIPLKRTYELKIINVALEHYCFCLYSVHVLKK